VHIRLAISEDSEALCAVDTVAATDDGRCRQIRAWIGSGCCYVVEANGRICGYGVLTDHFFGHAFIEMVMIGREFRRQGLGEFAIVHFQRMTAGSKLFSSTNMSNRPMQMLFAKCGFKPSGYIDNLDDGDPEIVFVSPAA